MKSANPSFVYEDLVCNMRKMPLGQRKELQMRLLGDRDAFVIGLRAEIKLFQSNLSQVGYQTMQCKEKLEVARAQQTACGSDVHELDFHIFCALEVKHALDELVSLVGEGDTIQRNIDSIQERLESEIGTRKRIEHDYHATLAQYYEADQKMKATKSSPSKPNVPATTGEVPNPTTTDPGLNSVDFG